MGLISKIINSMEKLDEELKIALTVCSIRLNNSNNIVETILKYNYSDFKGLNILNYEECQELKEIFKLKYEYSE